MKSRRALSICAAALVCAAVAPALAGPASVDPALRTLQSLHRRLGSAYAPLLRKAKAVMIFPGGGHDDALLLIQSERGWSEPAFYAPGLWHGGAPAVLLIMSERALEQILHQRGLTLDGPAALTLAKLVGRSAAADLMVWPPNGAAPDPDGFFQNDAANEAWYGQPRSAPAIVGGNTPDPRTKALRDALRPTGAGAMRVVTRRGSALRP